MKELDLTGLSKEQQEAVIQALRTTSGNSSSNNLTIVNTGTMSVDYSKTAETKNNSSLAEVGGLIVPVLGILTKFLLK